MSETKAEAPTYALTLSEEALQELMTVPGGETLHKMQEHLKERTADGSHTLQLNDMMLGRLVRLMAQGPKKVRAVLQKTVGGPLIASLQA